MIKVTKKSIGSKTTEYLYTGYGVSSENLALSKQQQWSEHGYHTSLTTTKETIMLGGRFGEPDYITRCYLIVSEYPIIGVEQEG